ncbi:MAG: alginate export family protein [Melioribacteraceae bacterium]|nr:alginate export family protein [Melioribacteraceae bacterium]
MKTKILILGVLFLALTTNSFAQIESIITGQIRARQIMDDLDFNSNTNMFSYAELRTRLGIELISKSDIKAFFQIQDSRVFGTEANTLTSTKNLDLHQGYFSIKNLLDQNINLKIGRMEKVLGNQRLVGSVGWSNVGRSFDGIDIYYPGEAVDLNLFSYNITESFLAGDSLDNLFYGLTLDIKSFENYSASVFVLALDEHLTDNDLYTLGTQINGNLGNYNHELEFAYQLGKGFGLDVNAFMFAYNGAFSFGGELNPKLSAGIDYLSGDDDPADNKYKTFNTLFATNHKFYGYMDYFINLPFHTYNLGLMDVHAKFALSTSKVSTIGANLHIFNSNQDYTLSDGAKSKSFGTELDIVGNFNYSKNVNFQGGFSFFAPGDIFKEQKGNDVSLWGFLIAQVSL